MSEGESYREASARAFAARDRLRGSFANAKARIAPARLKADVRNKAVKTMVDAGHSVKSAVQQRPIAASAAGIAFVAWLARRPLGTLFNRLFVRTDDGREDRHLSETDNG